MKGYLGSILNYEIFGAILWIFAPLLIGLVITALIWRRLPNLAGKKRAVLVVVTLCFVSTALYWAWFRF